MYRKQFCIFSYYFNVNGFAKLNAKSFKVKHVITQRIKGGIICKPYQVLQLFGFVKTISRLLQKIISFVLLKA